MTFKRTIATGISLSAFALSLSLHAIAQDNTSAEKTARTLEIVTVTATKRGENVQDIPASVTAISANELDERGLVDLRDISQIVPNLNWGEHFGTTLVTIRGVGSTVDSGVTEPTVAMYADGVYLPRSTMATLRAVDLERVEVLRGPQGTLYGRNATGGAVNFVSAAPSDTFEGEINLSTGSRDALGINGYISGPLAPGFKGRLSGGHEEQDGYVRVLNTGQRLNGTDVDYIRGALTIEPTSDLTVDLSLRYEESSAANAYQQLLTPSFLAAPSGQTTAPNQIVANTPFGQKVDTLIAAVTVDWVLSDTLSLRSITSYIDHTSDIIDVDADATGTDFFNTPGFIRSSESYGQEFNLLGSSGNVDWILGAFLFHEESGNSLPLRLGTVGGPASMVPAETIIRQAVDSEVNSWAIFGDATINFTDNFRLNLGLRYNDEELEFKQTLDVSLLPAAIVIPLETSSSKVLPKVALQYDISDNVNLYGQWAKGYKSGGVNLPGGGGELLGPTLGFYQPEEIDAFEIGLKSELFDRRVLVNLAAYYYDYSDLQLTITIPPSTTQVNNADASILGFEVESTWLVTDQFTIDASATIMNARFDGFSGRDDAMDPDGPGPLLAPLQNLDGEPVPHAPDMTFNIGGSYKLDLGGQLFSSLTLRGNVFYSDDIVLRYFGSPNDTQESYTLANLSASLTNASDNLALRVFVKNIGDEEYKQNVTFIAGGYLGNYAPPRTWGVKLTRRF